MPVTFTYKKTTSNKSKTIGQKPANIVIKGSKGGPSSHSLIPFIDRISVVLTPPNKLAAKAIFKAVQSASKNIELFQKFYPNGYGSKSRVALHVVISAEANKKKWPVLLCKLDVGANELVDMRAEFSPVDIGGDGLGEFHVSLCDIVPDGWKFFIQHGNVSMIEVTVDIPGVAIEDFHAVPVQGLSSANYKQNGKLETLNFGKSKGSQTKIYDRGKKRLAKKQKWHGPATTRIERRLKLGASLRLLDLPSLQNPFAALQMVFVTNGCPPAELAKKKEYLWQLFLDSARVRTLPAALMLLPVERRAIYRKWLKQNHTEWWQPELIWSHWTKVVEQSGLLSPPE